MKFIKKLLLIALILSIGNVYADDLKVCTPTEKYENYSKLSDEEKAKYIEPTYCSNIMDKSNKKANSRFSFKIKAASITDTYYNAFDDNIITPVKNQNPLGSCWAFSAISAVETNLLKNNLALYDFSESHMIYSLVSGAFTDTNGQKGRYYTDDMDGGTLAYAPSYYFNGEGQLLENEMPYETNTTPINSSNYVTGRKMISIKEFALDNLASDNVKCSADYITNIKSKILKTGSVQATIYVDGANFKDGMDYYLAKDSDEYISDDYPNHGIVIVGWDDSISKDKFNGATRNGAWIIKNSWGSTWSDDGLFYISYDDEFICNGVATFDGASTTTFDNTYKAADLVGNLYFEFTEKRYFSTKFTKQSTNDEKLKRVSFPVGTNSSHKVYISKANNVKDHSDWVLLGTGSSTTYGIGSIDISDDIVISDDFTIIVEYTIADGESTSFYMMCDISDDTAHLDYSTGINLTSTDGTSWGDVGYVNEIYHCEPNIWAYTNEILDNPTITLSNPVVVRNKATIDIAYENVNTNDLVFKVYNQSNSDVTSHFTITPNYTTKKITVESDNTISGTFTLKATYSTVTKSISFKLEKSITIEDESKMSLEDLNLAVAISKGDTLSYKELTDNINNNNITIEVYNAKGTKVESDTAVLGTGSTIKAGSTVYTIIVIGDSTGDGKIDSADLLKVVRHLKKTTTLTSAQLIAADSTRNNKIDSADLLKVVRFLKGTTTIGI